MTKSGHKLILAGVCFVLLYHVLMRFFFYRFISVYDFDFWELLINRFFVVTLICKSFFKFLQVVCKVCCFLTNYLNSFNFKTWLYRILVFKDLGCSELMLRNVWQSRVFLYIFVHSLLFFKYTSVSRNVILVFESGI